MGMTISRPGGSSTPTPQLVIEAGDGIAFSGDGTDGSPLVIRKSGGDIVLIPQLPTDAVITGDGQYFFTVPPSLDGGNITAVNLALTGAVASSGATTAQITRRRGGTVTDVLATPATVDATERFSTTGTIGVPVASPGNEILQWDILGVDVDAAGTDAKGLQVIITYAIPPH
jgi:hypothetical protein